MTDSELLAKFAGTGSAELFNEIVDRHSGMVYSVCFRVLGDAHAAEDASQATFLVLMRKAATLRPDTVLSGWLHVTALTSARQLRRTETRMRERERDVAGSAPDAAQPDDAEMWEEFRPQLDAALASLPPLQRDAIVLRYLKGMSHAEAAKAMNCPEETLHSRITHGMQKLRAKFKRRGTLISATALAALLQQCSTEATPPALAAGIKAACTGAQCSALVALTADAVTKAMFLAKLKAVAAVVLVVLLAAAVPVTIAVMSRPEKVPPPPSVVAAAAPAPEKKEPPVPQAIEPNDGDRLDDDTLWASAGALKIVRAPKHIEIHQTNEPAQMTNGWLRHHRQFPVDKTGAAMQARFNSAQMSLMSSFQLRAYPDMAEDPDNNARNIRLMYMAVTGKLTIGTRVDGEDLYFQTEVIPPGEHLLELVVDGSEVAALLDGKQFFRGAHGLEMKTARFQVGCMMWQDPKVTKFPVRDIRIGKRELGPADRPVTTRRNDEPF